MLRFWLKTERSISYRILSFTRSFLLLGLRGGQSLVSGPLLKAYVKATQSLRGDSKALSLNKPFMLRYRVIFFHAGLPLLSRLILMLSLREVKLRRIRCAVWLPQLRCSQAFPSLISGRRPFGIQLRLSSLPFSRIFLLGEFLYCFGSYQRLQALTTSSLGDCLSFYSNEI